MSTAESPAPTTAPRPPWGLWVVCVLVGSGLVTMWAAGRIKPLYVYPLLTGAALGGWASVVSVFCHVPRRTGPMTLVVLAAMSVTLGGLFLAAQRQAVETKPANPLAEKLLKQFEQQAAATTEAVKPISPIWWYLQQRYWQMNTPAVLLHMLLETLVASVACIGVMTLTWPALPGERLSNVQSDE